MSCEYSLNYFKDTPKKVSKQITIFFLSAKVKLQRIGSTALLSCTFSKLETVSG